MLRKRVKLKCITYSPNNFLEILQNTLTCKKTDKLEIQINTLLHFAIPGGSHVYHKIFFLCPYAKVFLNSIL